MVSVDVNVKSAQHKCQDLYVVHSLTYGGMSWHSLNFFSLKFFCSQNFTWSCEDKTIWS